MTLECSFSPARADTSPRTGEAIHVQGGPWPLAGRVYKSAQLSPHPHLILVLHGDAPLKRVQVDLDNLPDTGTLRGDLLALFKPQSIEEGERKLRAMAGFASMLSQHREFAEAATPRSWSPGPPRTARSSAAPPSGGGRRHRDGRAGHPVDGRLPCPDPTQAVRTSSSP